VNSEFASAHEMTKLVGLTPAPFVQTSGIWMEEPDAVDCL
jgi:hypothetical protein